MYAVRQRREGEPMLRRMRAAIFYRFFRLVSEIDAPVDVGDFRLIDRRVLLVLRGMPERHRYLRGMVAWVGLRQTGVEYVREERFAGQSKYPLAKLLQLGLNGVISFSDAPLRLALRLGLAISALAFFGGMAAIVVKLALPHPGHGDDRRPLFVPRWRPASDSRDPWSVPRADLRRGQGPSVVRRRQGIAT